MPQSTEKTTLARLAERFAEELPAKFEAIENMARQLSADTGTEAFANLERMVHNLCGTAPVFGYADLGAHAVRVEDFIIALRSGETLPDDKTLDQLKIMLFQLRDHAQKKV